MFSYQIPGTFVGREVDGLSRPGGGGLVTSVARGPSKWAMVCPLLS